jgi:hypothetical protein
MPSIHIEIPVAADGETIRLDELKAWLELDLEPAIAAAADEPVVVRAYKRLRPDSKTRDLLRVLPAGEANAATPEELGAQLGLTKAQARALIRNAYRLAKGFGLHRNDIVKVVWSNYSQEQAGRYYLDEDDHAALHAYLQDADQ